MSDGRPRVLVIDDEESMRFFLRRALTRRGFEVETADDGASGVERFVASRPDAVLLDVRLPGLGGREVLERIREVDARVPVLMMTGYATVDDAMGAMWSGATDYVRKPLKVDEVAGALERALAARSRAPDLPATVRSLASPGAAAGRGSAVRQARPRPRTEDPVGWLRTQAEARDLEAGDPEEGDLAIHDAVRSFERVYLDELLRRSGGNVARAARAAGVSRPNLHRKLRSLGMDADRYRKG